MPPATMPPAATPSAAPPIAMFATVTIGEEFNGPPASANGGYACGVLAQRAATRLGDPVAVTLHAPPPLGTALHLQATGRRVHAWAGEELIATVSAAPAAIDPVEPVTPSVAAAATDAFTGERAHPFPTCFVCGVRRPMGHGLFLRPGEVPGRAGTVACPWTPDGSVGVPDGTVPAEIVWAVLDCPGGWTTDPAREPRVLGRMVAWIDALPRVGQPYLVVGRRAASDGHTATNLTALYDESGSLVAHASATWVAVDPSTF